MFNPTPRAKENFIKGVLKNLDHLRGVKITQGNSPTNTDRPVQFKSIKLMGMQRDSPIFHGFDCLEETIDGVTIHATPYQLGRMELLNALQRRLQAQQIPIERFNIDLDEIKVEVEKVVLHGETVQLPRRLLNDVLSRLSHWQNLTLCDYIDLPQQLLGEYTSEIATKRVNDNQIVFAYLAPDRPEISFQASVILNEDDSVSIIASAKDTSCLKAYAITMGESVRKLTLKHLGHLNVTSTVWGSLIEDIVATGKAINDKKDVEANVFRFDQLVNEYVRLKTTEVETTA